MSKITFDIKRLVPTFIYSDRNGYALSKAIERAFQYVAKKVEEGLAILQDPDSMPEWRLDELAEDYNILYDYNADIEVKRDWVKNAIPYYRIYGTPEAIVQYLTGYFDSVELEEWFEYAADPFLFRLTVDGTWTPETEAWARKAIERAKNVRSVLDGLRIGCHGSIAMIATGEVESRIRYPSAGELRAGEYPTENIKLVIDETPNAGVDAHGEAQKIAYEMTGTYPSIAELLEIDETPKAGMDACGEAQKIAYEMTGTYPSIAELLEIDGTPLQADEAQEEISPIYYPMCGENSCGE